MKTLMRFAIRVHFVDEEHPRYAYYGRGDRAHMIGTLASYEGADTFAYPASISEAGECSKLLEAATSQWGRDAKIGMVLVDMTQHYARKLENAKAHVQALSEMLGV